MLQICFNNVCVYITDPTRKVVNYLLYKKNYNNNSQKLEQILGIKKIIFRFHLRKKMLNYRMQKHYTLTAFIILRKTILSETFIFII